MFRFVTLLVAVWVLSAVSASAADQLGIEEAIRLLTSKSPTDRQKASDALVELGEKAIPSLIDTAANSKHPARFEAIKTIGKMKAAAQPAIGKLAEILDSNPPFSQVGATIAGACEQLGPVAKDAVPALIRSLKNNANPTPAIRALGAIGPDAKEAVPYLADMLSPEQGGTPARRREIGEALVKIGPTSVRVLCKNYKALESQELLKRLLTKEYAAKMAEMLKDEDPAVRTGAIIGLAASEEKGKQAMPLRESLKDSDPIVRFQAAKALHQIDAPANAKAILPNLIEALGGENRAEALQLLEKLGPAATDATGAVIEATKDRNTRPAAILTLSSICTDSKTAVPTFIQAVKDPYYPVRAAGIVALGKLGKDAKEAVPTVFEHLRGLLTGTGFTGGDVTQALNTLRDIGGDPAMIVPVILETYEQRRKKIPPKGNGRKELCDKAASLLATLGDTALPTCADLLKGNDPISSEVVTRALGMMGGKATPILIEALKTGLARADAAQSLGKIGPAAKDAIPALTEALKDDDKTVKSAAADALKKIQGK